MGSVDRQSAGLPTAERITGYSPFADGVFRLRVVRVSGPPPEGRITLFSREIRTLDIGGSAESSIPTPGDAGGSITVGAVDWRGNALKAYSSQGPTDDGRAEARHRGPDQHADHGPQRPARRGRHLQLGPQRRRRGRRAAVGRTAGGLQRLRGRGARSAGRALALDLGQPGPDNAYGWGRVRVSIDPPRIGALKPASLASVRNRITVKFTGLTRSRLSYWTLTIDGVARDGARARPIPAGSRSTPVA